MNLKTLESIIRIIGFIISALVAVFNLSDEVKYYKSLKKGK